ARRAITTDVVPDTAGRPARVIVTTDVATLHKAVDADASARLGHTGPICAETARRLACHANIVPVVVNGASVPIDVGRTTRAPSVGQRDCLLVRDKACRGCGAPAHICVPHHCVHWTDLGPTDLNNLVLLCDHCHQLVHEGGWNVRWNPDNTVTFTTPDQRHLVRDPPT
ncbi:MAG: HNH endonuclease, partial [Actinobacteria bacterium]|nr:HNH endonuclease [Actinomycetota bacterium]